MRYALAIFAGLWASFASAEDLDARYIGPTDRYPHAVLGDALEWTRLELRQGGQLRRFDLPDNLVFEDLEPRVVDLDFDGEAEVITIESDQHKGARLAIYDWSGRISATPHIGTRFRWLAPIGAIDMDGDGAIEIGFIDRPHLRKTLVIYRYSDKKLTPWAELSGLTNHRIGDDFIVGGVRSCDQPEMLAVSADWSRIIAVSFENGALRQTDLGRYTRAKMERFLNAC